MNGLCCIGLSVASRIIGTYTMSLSILMINVFMSHFFARENEEDFFGTVESWAPIGLNWALVFRYFRLERRSQVIAICSYAILLYGMLFLISSAYLAFGSIARKPKCAVPWLYMQMISIIDQSTALGIQLMHVQYDVFNKSTWYIPLSCVYLLLSAYFWMVVQSARKEWFNGGQNQRITVSRISGNLPDETTTKSPSYVSLSFMTNQSSYQPSTTLPFYDASNSAK
ncbi:hypothetical protein KPH14_004149 [Odynerus spinipes]|uniref:Uncharacterized protein n=1 Tax=Odynerus spinipes TaxID=1348599 RepID=A0AAD9RY34_9HYME|nr:hypothetical protein KPH14_004149 [Odynerus spinipes]